MSHIDNEPTYKKGIYLLPNLFTTAGLFSGFYAIVSAMKGNFEIAAIAVFIAMIMDSFDGRVARLTGTQSQFGAQYDSLSDMVCFGVTPALVVYSWGLQYLGKFGWLAAFLYVAATALRLARFNIQINLDKKFFIGLPCPAAAGVIAGMVWVGTDFAIPGRRVSELAAIVTILTSMLMVSNLKFHSFKDIDLKDNVPFVAVLIVVLVYSLIAWDPPKILFSMFFIFALSGPYSAISAHRMNAKQAKLAKQKAKADAENLASRLQVELSPENSEVVISKASQGKIRKRQDKA